MNIAFIPARGGSKSIKNKNIKEFCGKPLIYWNLVALQQSSNIDMIVVATDCEEIKDVVLSFNIEKLIVYDREEKNARDNSSTEDVMLEFINKNNYNPNDSFLLVQATSPLTESKDFDEAIRKFKNEAYDSLLTCVRFKRFLWNEKREPINYNINHRPRRQDFDGVLLENGAFYISTIRNIKSTKNRISGKIGIYEMNEIKAVEIDEEEDWIIAEALLRKRIQINNYDLSKYKIIISDVDGVLTDAGMYYTEHGDEMKKFCTYDGMAFKLFKESGLKTALITSETTQIVANRAKKLKIDYCVQGAYGIGKLEACTELCEKLNISLDQVIYIGDDINCYDLLMSVGLACCPKNANKKIYNIQGILKLESSGGEGVVRELYETISCIEL